MRPENQPSGGLLIVNPRALFPTPPTRQRPLVVLFDPTPERAQTARRLAQVGNWRVMAVDSNRAELAAPAMDGIVSAAQGGSPTSYNPAAFVLEAYHPLRPPLPPEEVVAEPALTAFELVRRLTRFHPFDFVPFVLYTADREILVQARHEYEATRRDHYHRLHLFDGTVQRDSSAESDLALAQLLDQLINPPPVGDPDEDMELPF